VIAGRVRWPETEIAMWCGALQTWFDRETKISGGVRRAVVRYRSPLRSCTSRQRVVRCIDGCAWVTVEGDIADKVLAAGQELVIPARRLALVTGMNDCVVEICDPRSRRL
jgi:hypothetical protein